MNKSNTIFAVAKHHSCYKAAGPTEPGWNLAGNAYCNNKITFDRLCKII